MLKKITALIIAAAMCLTLCACGDSGRYKIIKTLGSQSYSIALRGGDSNYYYLVAALSELNYEGKIDALAREWLGDENAVSFPKDRDALSEYDYISARKFIIGCDLESYPMCYKDGEEYTGFDVELARLVCDKLGWDLVVQPISSEDTYVELNSGNIDCAWGGIIIDPSSDKFTVVRTYFTNKLVLAGLKGEGSGLHGKTLCIGSGSTYEKVLEENPHIAEKLGRIMRVQGTPLEFMRLLDKGDCDLIITTDTAVSFGSR